MTQAFSIVRDISRSVVRNVPVSLGGLESFSPADLFASGEDGGWYDPSDLTSMYKGITGTGGNPSVGDQVGVVLDKSQMGGQTAASFIAGQPELISGLWLTASTQNFSQDDGVIFVQNDGTTYGAAYIAVTGLTIGRSYLLTGECIARTGGGFARAGIATNTPDGSLTVAFEAFNSTTTGAFSYVYVATSTSVNIQLGNRNDTDASSTYTNISFREVPGNHLVAPADIQRPILRDEIVDGTSVDVSGQPELLTNGDFSDGTTGWTPNGVVATHSVEDGRYKIVSTNPYPISSKQISGLTVGRWYIASADYEKSNFDNLTRLWVSTAVAGTNWTNASVFSNSNNGSFSIIFRAEATSGFVNFRAGIPTGTGTLYVDNVSVREVPASAARRYYLDFDGVDDELDTSGYTGTANPSSIFTAYNPGSDTNYILHSSATSALHHVFVAQDGSTNTVISFNAGTPTYRLDGAAFTPADRNAARDSTAGAVHVLGIESLDLTNAAYQSLGVFNYGTGFYLDGAWYGSVFIDRALTTAERYQLEYVLAQDSGVTYAAPVLDGVPTIG